MLTAIAQALASFHEAQKYNPQSVEISKKIKRLSQLDKEKKRSQEVENIKSNVDMRNFFGPLKPEIVSFIMTIQLFIDLFLCLMTENHLLLKYNLHFLVSFSHFVFMSISTHHVVHWFCSTFMGWISQRTLNFVLCCLIVVVVILLR